MPDALLRVVRRYQSERRADEPFYNWARRVPNDDLRRTLGEVGTGTPVVMSATKAPAAKRAGVKRAGAKAPAATKTATAKQPANCRPNRVLPNASA